MNSYVSLASPQRCCILSAKSQKHTMLVLKVRSVFMPRPALLCFALRSTCVALLWCSDSIILELGSQWVLTLGLHPQKLQTFSRLEWNCFGICDLHKTNNNLTINNLANPVNLVPLLWIYLLLGFMTKFDSEFCLLRSFLPQLCIRLMKAHAPAGCLKMITEGWGCTDLQWSQAFCCVLSVVLVLFDEEDSMKNDVEHRWEIYQETNWLPELNETELTQGLLQESCELLQTGQRFGTSFFKTI